MVRGRMLEIAVPQPIDDCLRVLGEMLAADTAVGANIVIAATKHRSTSVHSHLVPYHMLNLARLFVWTLL